MYLAAKIEALMLNFAWSDGRDVGYLAKGFIRILMGVL